MFKHPTQLVSIVAHVKHDRLLRAAGIDPEKFTLQKVVLYDDWTNTPHFYPLALIVGEAKHGKVSKGRKQ